jgi:hypothetical protein
MQHQGEIQTPAATGTVRLHRVLKAPAGREMEVTVELRAVIGGTDLRVTQEGIPAAIPVEMCYLGWQESLAQLAALVEPEIPDGA